MESLIGPVPPEWLQLRLAEVCDVLAGPSDARLKANTSESAHIPVVTPKDFRDNRVVRENVILVEAETAEKFTRYWLEPGDILSVRSGDLGRQALIATDQAGWLFGSACLRLRPGRLVIPRYLVYYLGHPSVRDWMIRNATGSAILSLSTKTLQSMPVVLPPLGLQSTISEILDALDEKAAIHDEIARVTRALRETVLPLLVAGSPPLAEPTAL